MREERTRDEVLIDDVLILSLYAMTQDSSPEQRVGDRLKAMKLVFLANHAMFKERAKGLNCTFYKWNLGPISNEVYYSWAELKSAGLMLEEEELTVTRQGMELAREFLTDVLEQEENRFFRKVIGDIARQWGGKSRNSILSAVYNMRIRPLRHQVEVTIKDAPLSAHFTEVLDPSDARIELVVPEAWQETLALLFKPTAVESIARAEDDARAGRILEGDEIWSFFESPAV